MILAILSIAASAESPDWYAAQARQFLKRGWTADAEADVRAGLAVDPGHLELNALCVELARKIVDIPRALECASRGAKAPEGDLELRAELSRLETWMRENFGRVQIIGPDGTPRGAVEVHAVGLMLDPELKAAAATISSSAARGIPLPSTLSLPTGDYEVEGTATRVEPGQTTVVTLSPSAFAAKAGRGVRLELAVGGAGYVGPGLQNQLPGGQFELGVSLPAGVLRLGAAATWDLRPYSQNQGEDTISPYGWGGRLRLGREIELGTAFLVSPGAVLSVGQLPGIELACSSQGQDLTCENRSPTTEDEAVYATGWLVAPGAELSLASRMGRSVIGVRVGTEHVFGQIPSPGNVQRSDGVAEYTLSDPEVHAWTGYAAVFMAFGL